MVTTRMDAGVVLTAAAPADLTTKTSPISTSQILVRWMLGYVSHHVRAHSPQQRMSLFLQVHFYALKILAIRALVPRDRPRNASRTKGKSDLLRIRGFLPSQLSPMHAFCPLQIPVTAGILLILLQRSFSDVFLLFLITFKPQMQQHFRLMFRC